MASVATDNVLSSDEFSRREMHPDTVLVLNRVHECDSIFHMTA
jgi:hypothetical protein